jgi:hypothetical protein
MELGNIKVQSTTNYFSELTSFSLDTKLEMIRDSSRAQSRRRSEGLFDLSMSDVDALCPEPGVLFSEIEAI